jgi:hypothetical protein
MSQTPERRIFLPYKATKKRYDYRRGGGASVLMQMAKRYKMPIREVLRIIKQEKEKNA